LSREEAAADQARIRAAEQAQKAIEDQIKSLEMQRDMFEMTTTQATLYRISLMDGVTPAQLELAAAILETIEAQEADAASRERGLAITESVKTAVEKYAETLEELSTLLVAGAINQETYNRAVVGAVETFNKSTEEAGDGFADLQRAIEGWGRSSADAFAEMAMGSKASFSDLINSMIRDMIKMAAYQAIFGPLFAGMGSVFSGGTFSSGVESFRVGRRAIGGRVGAGGMYEVNERGPEMLSVGNRQFLRMGKQSGLVSPDGGSGGSVVVSIDARGADAQLLTALPPMLNQWAQAIKSDIAMSQQRQRAIA
jgi:phage-related minor tail protein